MEATAVTGLSGLSILIIAIAIWFLTSKGTRQSVGNSVQVSAMQVEQALTSSILLSAKEVGEELGFEETDPIELAKKLRKASAELRGMK